MRAWSAWWILIIFVILEIQKSTPAKLEKFTDDKMELDKMLKREKENGNIESTDTDKVNKGHDEEESVKSEENKDDKKEKLEKKNKEEEGNEKVEKEGSKEKKESKESEEEKRKKEDYEKMIDDEGEYYEIIDDEDQEEKDKVDKEESKEQKEKNESEKEKGKRKDDGKIIDDEGDYYEIIDDDEDQEVSTGTEDSKDKKQTDTEDAVLSGEDSHFGSNGGKGKGKREGEETQFIFNYRISKAKYFQSILGSDHKREKLPVHLLGTLMQKLGISQHYQLSKDAVLELFQERKYLDIFKKSYGLTDEGVHSFYRMCSPEITWKHPEDVGSKVVDPLVSHHEGEELQKFNDCFEIWQDEEFEYQKKHGINVTLFVYPENEDIEKRMHYLSLDHNPE